MVRDEPVTLALERREVRQHLPQLRRGRLAVDVTAGQRNHRRPRRMRQEPSQAFATDETGRAGDQRGLLRGQFAAGGAKVGSVIFISVTDPYFRTASGSRTRRRSRPSPGRRISEVTRDRRGNCGGSTLGRVPRNRRHRRDRDRRTPCRRAGARAGRGLDRSRKLTQQIALRRGNRVGVEALRVQPIERREREVHRFGGFLGLGVGGDLKCAGLGETREAGARAVAQPALDPKLGVEHRAKPAAEYRVGHGLRRAGWIRAVRTDVAKPEIGLGRARLVDEQQAMTLHSRHRSRDRCCNGRL